MKQTYKGVLYSILLYATSIFTVNIPLNFEQKVKNYPIAHLIQLLHYDPLITIYPPLKATESKNDVTIYVHDLLENQSRISFLQHNTDLLPGTVIGFNFKDAMRGAYMPTIKETNFGQANDIASLLMVMLMCDECNLPSFHLFGTGRGAQTILTTIARLDQYRHYKSFFRKLGICKNKAHRLLEKTKKGTLVLNCPLIDLNTSIKEKLAPFGMSWASSTITYCLLPTYTNYSPLKDSGLGAAKHVQALDIPILIHCQKNNLIYGNKADILCYKALFGPHTYLILGSDGGHEHLGESLSPALHAFRSIYNGPHDKNKQMLEKGMALLKQAQPPLKNAREYIHTFYAQHAYTFIPKPEVTWQHNFKQYDFAAIEKTLGYDPSIRMYQSDNACFDTPTSPTVYVHGYGDNYKFTVPLFQRNTYLLPGSIVSFNFQDVTEGAFKVKVNKSSIGQSADIAAFVSVLKVLDECGVSSINLFGYSRGGATIITSLGRLCTYDDHAPFFNSIHVSKQQATQIIHKIKNGTIVLNCPLVHTRAVANYWFGNFGNTLLNSIIPHIMEHKGYEDQALKSAHIIQKENFKILVHFQKKDTILGNSLIDALFYKRLKGPYTYLVIADEGGHIHTGETLGKAVQAFKKKYHGAYYPIADLLKQGTLLLKQSPKSNQATMNYVAHSYQETLLSYDKMVENNKTNYYTED